MRYLGGDMMLKFINELHYDVISICEQMWGLYPHMVLYEALKLLEQITDFSLKYFDLNYENIFSDEYIIRMIAGDLIDSGVTEYDSVSMYVYGGLFGRKQPLIAVQIPDQANKVNDDEASTDNSVEQLESNTPSMFQVAWVWFVNIFENLLPSGANGSEDDSEAKELADLKLKQDFFQMGFIERLKAKYQKANWPESLLVFDEVDLRVIRFGTRLLISLAIIAIIIVFAVIASALFWLYPITTDTISEESKVVDEGTVDEGTVDEPKMDDKTENVDSDTTEESQSKVELDEKINDSKSVADVEASCEGHDHDHDHHDSAKSESKVVTRVKSVLSILLKLIVYVAILTLFASLIAIVLHIGGYRVKKALKAYKVGFLLLPYQVLSGGR